MVKKTALLALLVISFSINSYASSKQSQYNMNDLLGTYKAISLVKEEYCISSVKEKDARLNFKKNITLSKKNFVDFWSKLQSPSYHIEQLTPEIDEVVYPRYLQLLFNYNGTYLDQLTFLTVRNPSDNTPYEYFEIVDDETLLLESGCWIYTLKRIKE